MDGWVIVAVVAIIAGTVSTIARHIFSVGKAAVEKKGAEGSSLTTSELQRMIQAAVEGGNAQIEKRFDVLEKRLDRLEGGQAALPPRSEPVIDPRLLDADEEQVPTPRRTRTS